MRENAVEEEHLENQEEPDADSKDNGARPQGYAPLFVVYDLRKLAHFVLLWKFL